MKGSATVTLNGIAICLVGLMASCGGNPQDSAYLGQRPPGETPALFAPGIVNTAAIELNGVVSPDGREFFFTRVIDDVFIMHRCLLGEDGGWSDPEPVYTYPDRAPGLAVDMAYSPDGSRLYFLGRYSAELEAEETNSDLFVIERQGNGGWSLASALSAPVNTPDYKESYPSVVADGSLYFSSDRPGGQGQCRHLARATARGRQLRRARQPRTAGQQRAQRGRHLRRSRRELAGRDLTEAGRHRRRRSLRVFPSRRRGLGRAPATPADDQQRFARLLPDGHSRRPLPFLFAPHGRQLGRRGRGGRVLGGRRRDREDASVSRWREAVHSFNLNL